MKLIKYKYLYTTIDLLSAFIAWNLIFAFYKSFILSNAFVNILPFWQQTTQLVSSILIPFFWIILYYLSGYYNNPLRKTLLEDVGNTIVQSLIGVCIIFIILFFLGSVGNFQGHFTLFFLILFIHITITVLFRMGLTSFIIRLKINRKISFRTLMIGRIHRIAQMKMELQEKYPGHSHLFIGYMPVETNSQILQVDGLVSLGEFADLHDIVMDHSIEDIIIVLNENDVEIYKRIILLLNSSHVELKVNTELYPFIKGKVNISSLFQYPLIHISRDLLPPGPSILKNSVDIFGALVCLLITLPISLTLMIVIFISSEGKVIYSHERIGRFGKTFKILKFRSMIKNAEANGPQLATKNDPRITRVGRFMRRLRLDEIPNFINVLKGDMSLVGPRPERKFYMDQIIARAPEYKRLLQVKPGVTSWGQVKYGYAENIDEMIRRMRYDLLYIENMSLYVDFQILVRTIIIILKGRGI